MRIRIVAASNRQPTWVEDAYRHYAKRLRGALTLELREVPLARRRGSSGRETIDAEGERLLAALPKGAHVVALHETGTLWTSRDIARRLEDWMALGAPVGLLIGGPDGLAPRCFEAAAEQWSLSPLTLPHGIARIVAAEALYRAWTILQGHPYHRG